MYRWISGHFRKRIGAAMDELRKPRIQIPLGSRPSLGLRKKK